MLANKKPWGYEFLAFQNEHVAIWHLFIKPWEETSLHCHPNKKTGLVVLEGGAEVNFLSGKEKLFAGDKIMIRQGVFHQTKNRTSSMLELFEIETPIQKNDIVRVRDKYGRNKQPYGSEELIEIATPNYITNKFKAVASSGRIEKYKSVLINTELISYISSIDEERFKYYSNSQYMILYGGLFTSDGITICGPGDILSAPNIYKLAKEFHIPNDSLALRISNEN